MGYNKQNFKRIREAFAGKHRIAEQRAEEKRQEIHAKLPRVAEIDRRLSRVGIEIMSTGLMDEKARTAAIERLRAENEALLSLRAKELIAAGYPSDYTDVSYDCPHCADSGYVGIKMCDCMKQALVLAGLESSGISHLLKEQTFESFSLDYYRQDPVAYANMERVFRILKDYVESFEAGKSVSLSLFGGTGLGKTHLSSAVARRVIERGYDVVYVTALDLIADFETEQFSRSMERGELTEKYFECDLLIIDDLGTEVSNQFTVSTVYNLFNSRINRRAATLISTNLTQQELLKKYNERITSRIFGEFRPLLFMGADVRLMKTKIKKENTP